MRVSFDVKIVQAPVPIRVAPDETILAAALDAGIPYPHGCQSGNCGACKSHLLAGDVTLANYSDFALSDEERASGMILACRAMPRTDCEVAWQDEDDLISHPRRTLDCAVAEIADATHDIRRVRLTIDKGGPFSFSAGQFASVTFGNLPPRDYSMANRPSDPILEFHVRRTPGGTSSEYVASRLEVGDRVRVVGPYGTSYLRESHRGPIIAVAGGSGLAPITSIVEQVLARKMPQPIHLYFGARDEPDLYLADHFAGLMAGHANLQFVPVLNQPSGPTARRTGLVHEAVAADFVSFDGCKAYLAGPPVMVEAATRMLAARGLRRIDIHADAFYTASEMHQAGRKTGDQM